MGETEMGIGEPTYEIYVICSISFVCDDGKNMKL